VAFFLKTKQLQDHKLSVVEHIASAEAEYVIRKLDHCIYVGYVRPFRGKAVDDVISGVESGASITKLSQMAEFSFVRVCLKKNTVELYRDCTGFRKLFYTVNQGELLISDNVFELADKVSHLEFSAIAAEMYINYEFIAEPFTFFEGVLCAPKGAIFDAQSGEVLDKAQPLVSYDQVDGEISELSTTLRGLIAQAHERRVGGTNAIYLSGGIDSSVMAVTLTKDLGLSDVSAFTFSTLGSERDESAYAKQCAQDLGLKFIHVEVDPKKSDFTR